MEFANRTNNREIDGKPCINGYVSLSKTEIICHPADFDNLLLQAEQWLCLLRLNNGSIGLARVRAEDIHSSSSGNDFPVMATLLPVYPNLLGDAAFCQEYQLQYPYMAGSMAFGISSVNMVTELAKAGMLASFGAGGLLPAEIGPAIDQIRQNLGQQSFAVNLIYQPLEAELEKKTVALLLEKKVTVIEASAYMDLTPWLVWYRLAGLAKDAAGKLMINNRIIAKVSRKEVALKFLHPAPAQIVHYLQQQGLITEEQKNLSPLVAMADDITVEGDSGGHTDNRPLISLLPAMIYLRNQVQQKLPLARTVRIGAAGGMATPPSVLAALIMGAAYVVTGSINQSCLEAGTSTPVKNLLATCEMADVCMAPAADMFEMGVKLQVLRRGTMFAQRAQKLYDLYQAYPALEAIPADELKKLESTVFAQPLSQVWQETCNYFNQRQPEEIQRANLQPKQKMALVFRWYLGQAAHWAIAGKKGREMDYQIWCGQSMGAFNQWVKGNPLEKPLQRSVTVIARQLMNHAGLLYRQQQLRALGLTK